MRWAAWASLLTVSWSSISFGQSPTSGTIRMHSAGQPDHVLKVVKTERMSDGHVLVELKDVKTGDVYTLMDPSFAVQLKPAERPPTPTKSEPLPNPVPPISPEAEFPIPIPAAPSISPPAVASIGTQRPLPISVNSPVNVPVPSSREVRLPDLAPLPLQPVSLAPRETIRPYVQSSVNAATARYGTEPPEVRMQREIAPWVAELTRALRPSVRMDAATALAEGRYGWRDEVKAHLMQAAATDPAAVVRAHCISLLSTLGYAETEYRNFLASCSADRSADVRVAASIALARLEPR